MTESNQSTVASTADKQDLPEITLKVIVVGFFLTIILTAANAYLGLKVGMTISASIPAAVISMAILRRFKEHNILENNIVQTMASAGGSTHRRLSLHLTRVADHGHLHSF